MTGEVAAHVHLVRVAGELLGVRHRDLVVERDVDDALDHEADESDADVPLVALDGAQHKERQNEEDGRVRHEAERDLVLHRRLSKVLEDVLDQEVGEQHRAADRVVGPRPAEEVRVAAVEWQVYERRADDERSRRCGSLGLSTSPGVHGGLQQARCDDEGEAGHQ